ncbi:MAG: alpha/beta fold hydrolase [Selenomonadaceae bacterium]|nr:alpha/beta fold hydrolase [Selenomonadaceae bacterium]
MDTAYIDSEEYVPGTTMWINGVYSLKGGAGNTTITGSKLDDTIISGTGKTTIDAGDGDDYIINSRAENILSGSDGNDTISNDGSNVSINAGDGDDYIINSGAGNILRGNAGNDTISNDGDNLSINGGAGSDSIVNTGDNVSINAGDGDDLITNTGENVLFKYYSTGGNYSIVGFDSTSTLSIASEYSSSVSGNDLIVTVGDSKITLIDAASLSSANIESTDLSPSEQLTETILKRTALGYPAMAARAFSPDAKFGDEPTNYAEKEDWNITSTDDLELHAVHYTPENSNDKWVVLVHGYGNNHKAMYLYATSYLENGYNVLMIDQRAAGESEGTWLTMGGAESKDVALWTQEIARRNSNAKITLHGVSMGSATAMLAASRSDATNVVALIEDCGYTSAMEVFYLLNGAYVGAPTEVIAGMDEVAEEFTGHYISEAAPIDSISSAKMPTLFISGDADTVVPVSMLSELYDASGAEVKEKFIVKDAPHALAGLNDSIGYNNAVFRFIAEANGEGWDTTNITDNISLRGTKYNDTIANYGSNVTIQAQDGDDSISNFGDNVSIDAGKGDDLISLSGGSVLVQYAEGDGNDTIIGFDSNSTLSIGDNVYSTQLSGDDLIITIGESKLTLVDAANLSDPNIESTNEVVMLVEAILKRTAAGYPLASGILLNPEELVGEEPTNYAEKEDWSITSADNLELYGVHYAPENSNDKWVVLVHGYGLKYESMYPFATFYLENGYNVLMIDQRAAGNSEGTWLTMGAAESQDVALWTQEIARRNSNAKITLHGVSMGSATAMLAAARSDAVNVTSLIEDCGYTSAMKLFYVLKDVLNEGLKEFGIEEISSEVVAAMDSVGHGMMGYYLHDAAPIDSISSAKMPTLFISGDDDGVVPVSMLSELYDASGAEVKEKFIVKDAGHAQAGLNDPRGYSNAVFRFIAEANGEGWNTENLADNISLRGTKYNDTIANYGSNVTINAGDGDDSISNLSEYSIIDGGSGNDTIYNYSPTGILASNGVSINAGDDDDTIINEHAYYVTLDGGEGDDKIIVRIGDHTTIDGGSGNDTILGETIEGGNSTWAMGGYANINGGSGDDYINPIFSDSASILGGEGNDTIINEGDDATINGGAGDDIISLQGASLNNDVIKYEAGDGNDIIYGFNETTKLSITAGSEYSTVESGDDVIVNVGDNTITIAGGASLSTINIINYEIPALNITNTTNNTLITGTENNDTIRNSGSNVSISGAAGDDSITSSGANSSIHGGAGSDTIRNNGASSSIFGAEGDDRLINTADEALIDGSYGSDTITNSGDSVTIRPGGGSDSISNSGDNVVINYTGGNDSIQGFNATSTLSLSSDDYDVIEGSRDIFVLHGESFAVLQGALLTNDSININDTAYEVEGKVISLEDGGDEVAISRSNVSIVGGTGDDIIILTSDAANNTIEYAGGNDTIYGFNETSKLSITGKHSSIKIGDDVIINVGDDSITLVDASSVMATDFEEGESLLLTEKGAVTVGNRIFELTERVKNGVTITGTADGFTAGTTDKDGKTFVEEFIAVGDDGYHVLIDSDGLQTISGIDAGTEITTSATKDGVDAENAVYIVTEDAGKYTFNEMAFTTSKDNATIRLRPTAMAFDSVDGIVYDGKTFAGGGNVTVNATTFAPGANVSATGVENGESFILAQKGTTTINGRTFELTEDIPDGMTIEGADSGYTFSHVITEKEIIQNGVPSDYLGKVYSEEVHVAGDDSYILQADSFGLRKVSGISDGASINGGDTSVDGDYNDKYAAGGQNLYLDTDTEGTFTIGEKSYSISGDSNVEIKAMLLSEKSYAGGFNNLAGTVSGNFDGDEFFVNGSKNPILIGGDDLISVVGSSDGTKLFGVSGNATLASLGGVSEVHTDTEGEFWIAAKPVPFGVTVTGDDNVTFGFNDKGDLMTVDDLEGSIEFSKGTGGALSINGIGIHTRGIDFSSIGAYDNSLYIHDIERGTITAYELEKVWLQMSGETMTLNGNELTLTADSDGIWLRDKEIVGLDAGASLQVSEAGTYTANTTELEAKAGDVIVGLEGDAYIYNGDNLLITPKTPNAEIISHFKPKNQTVVGASETTNQNITLNGGDLAIVEATAAPVNITAGDDTVVSQGENVAVNLTGGNTWLFPIGGKMTLEGYDASTGTGFGTTYTDIASAVADGKIDFNDGRLTLGAAKVDMGNSSELMNFFDRDGDLQKVGYASRNDSLDVSNATDDLLLVAKKDSTITGGAGDDTISVAARSFVDAGAGSNLVSMSSDSGRSNIAFNGNTTVEGFHTGFGRGSDTVYISEVYPAVDFKEGVLTFYDDTNSLTFKGITKTAQINTYYAENGTTAKEVYIADDEWYDVADGAADYYVGATATKNHGIDFSGITTPVNVTLNTDYNSPTAIFWVNNIHSIIGGAGNTSITGSDKADTILAGTGRNNIWSGAGNDLMFGNTDEAKKSSTFFHMTGDGRDTIEGFDFMDNASDSKSDVVKLGSAITGVSLNGEDVILQINNNANDSMTLTNAKGKTFNLNDDLIAKVGDNEVAFDGFTNCYAATGSNATLTIGAGMGKVEVWLGDTSLDKHGTMFYGNFRELNAAQADGSNILAGNELSNVITGGSGNNSLWGGAGSASDTLVGGTGHNDFFFCAGNGNDVIQGTNDGDNVILDGITLDQIARADIYAGSVFVNFNDGSFLKVDGTADVTYQLADGSRYSANHSRREWSSK